MADTKHPAEVLAQETEQAEDAYDLPGVKRAADMLRRIPALESERDALKETLHDELAENLALRELGGAGPDEGMTQFLRRVIAERDRLLAEVEAMRKDAERYRWLRDQHFSRSPMCVVMKPKDALKLGRYCPGGELLDAEIDAAIAAIETKETKCQPDGLKFDAFGNPRTRHVRVTLHGSHCVMHPSEGDCYVRDARDAGDPDWERYIVRDVWLSEREFEDLPEHDGF
jgi:hypothetical protein